MATKTAQQIAQRGANILNAIRQNATADYQTRVPLATQNNIQEVGNPILAYQSTQNEFLNALVNKIAFSIVTSRIAENPLKILKKGTVPLGQDIEDIFVNMAKAKRYDPDGKNLLQREIPDIKSAYYRLNRQDMYKVTISNDQLRLAFTSYEQLESLIAGIVNSLYSGDNFDEFLIMKNLVVSAVNNNVVKTEVTTKITDETSAKSFVKKLRSISSLMKFPSSNYNNYVNYSGDTEQSPIVTWSPVERQLLLIRSDILAEIDVDVLAVAFNMSKTDFLGRILEVDKFDEGGKIQAILCDESFFQCWDNLTQMTEFYNGEGLYWQYMWHHWQTMAVSPFANAIVFLSEEWSQTLANSLTLVSPASAITMETGDTENIAVEVNADDGTYTLNYSSSDTKVAKVQNGRIIAVAKGTATITVTLGGELPGGETPAKAEIAVTVV